jgi:hypothetical protein
MYKGGIIMKKFYVLSTILIIVGLCSIVFGGLEYNDHDLENSMTRNDIKENIISESKKAMQDKLNEYYANIKLSVSNVELTEDNQRIDELLDFSDQYFDALSTDVNLALAMLTQTLNEEEIMILETILAEAFSEETSVNNDVTTLSGGYAKLRLYVHASWGWFYGRLSTTLLVVAITPVVIQFAGLGAAAGGPVGVIVGALIGSTLGVAIERYINHLVYRNGTAGFTYDLINTTLVEGWLVPFKITIQYNLLNAIFSIINFAGGNWSAGAAGATRPSTLPGLSYA